MSGPTIIRFGEEVSVSVVLVCEADFRGLGFSVAAQAQPTEPRDRGDTREFLPSQYIYTAFSVYYDLNILCLITSNWFTVKIQYQTVLNISNFVPVVKWPCGWSKRESLKCTVKRAWLLTFCRIVFNTSCKLLLVSLFRLYFFISVSMFSRYIKEQMGLMAWSGKAMICGSPQSNKRSKDHGGDFLFPGD